MAGSIEVSSSIFGYFADNGHKTGLIGLTRRASAGIPSPRDRCTGTIAPNTRPMLDSRPMCASAGKSFEIPRSLRLPGSLALLLRR
jgi:hypothetical protein